MIKVGNNLNILLKDGTEATGTVEKVNNKYLILDDEGAFGDMVIIHFSDIKYYNDLKFLYSIASDMINMGISTSEDIKAYGYTDHMTELILDEMKKQ